MEKELLEKLTQHAVKLLGKRMYSTEQLRVHLSHYLYKKKISDRDIYVNETISFLVQNNLLNDVVYAGSFSHDRALLRPRSKRMLRAELERKGKKADMARGLDFGSGPYPMMAELMAERGFILELYDPIFAPRNRQDLLATAFDYVLCCETAEHFYRPFEEFELMTKLLAPDGIIAIMTSLRRPDSSIANWHYAQDETHVALYSEKTMYWIARRFNLRIRYPANGVIFLDTP